MRFMDASFGEVQQSDRILTPQSGKRKVVAETKRQQGKVSCDLPPQGAVTSPRTDPAAATSTRCTNNPPRRAAETEPSDSFRSATHKKPSSQNSFQSEARPKAPTPGACGTSS